MALPLLCSVEAAGNPFRVPSRLQSRRNRFRLQRGLVDHTYRGQELTETVQDMRLHDYVSHFHYEGCKDALVTVTFDTERCSGGSFLEGEVNVKLQFRCIWANHKIKSWNDCVDLDEVPFPPSAGHLDITQSVAMAIEQGFPRLKICGLAGCASSAQSGVRGSNRSGWTTAPEPHSTPFSCLEDLKRSLTRDS